MMITASDGVELHAEIDGPADAPVTAVLVHGWTLDARTWGPVAKALVAGPHAVRVIRPDHRGHGRSGVVDPTTMTLEQLADDLRAVLDAAAPTGPLVLVGHSMGGMTMMALAERHPEVYERVQGVGLVSTASGGLSELTLGLPPALVIAFNGGEKRLYANERWRGRQRLGNPRLLGPALSWLLLGSEPSRLAYRMTTEVVAACRPATVAGFRPTLDAHERDAALATFAAIPTVVLVGARDRLTPVASARRISAVLPTASLTVLPGAGHMLPVERVDEVVAAIEPLLTASVPAAATTS